LLCLRCFWASGCELMETRMDLPQYDELHVISDLHMGGERTDFQILRETKRLAGFIYWVAEQRPGGRVGLVLNGDVVDTLAEEISGYIAVNNAVATVERIIKDTSFAQVWEALTHFMTKPNRTLVIVIGNHDIELALPPVQRLILSRLAADNDDVRGRIEFSTVGAGYTCLVGGARVFCIHGNEVDPWNYVRYEDLSKVARRLNAGRSLEPSEWEPNAGTKMVKDVMNEVKRRYAWIDLLKPETQAAVGVLLVLDPSQVSKITRLPSIVGERVRGGSAYEGRLSADGFVATSPATARPARIDQLLGPNIMQGLQGRPGSGLAQITDDTLVNDMLKAAEMNYQTRRMGSRIEDETLGLPRLMWDRLTGWITGVGKAEALRRALLDWLGGDTTFTIDDRDDTFNQVTQSVGTGIDFIVTGHTHLERAINMGGGRFYFNCGTWIRLLRFTDAMLKDTASFQPVYNVLEDGRMSRIDAAESDGKPFVLNQTSAVCIKTDPAGVVGALGHVDSAGLT
jgi:UDP-2,3-diacylglucosamine pyrophosphatase LpxH